jgi:hypothetical protein
MLITRMGLWLQALCCIGHLRRMLLFPSTGLSSSLVFLFYLLFLLCCCLLCSLLLFFFFAALDAGLWAMMYVIFATLFVKSGDLLCNHDDFFSSRLSESVPVC